MKKTLLITLIICSSIFAFGQNLESLNNNNGLCRTTFKLQGIYIFVRSEPVNTYSLVKTIKLKVFIGWDDEKKIERAVKRLKKKNPSFNGLIIRANGSHRVDLIQFKK